MNKSRAEAKAYCERLLNLIQGGEQFDADMRLAVPVTCLDVVASSLSQYSGRTPSLAVGVQNSHWLSSGAHTGELAPEMIAEAGASFSILGHSERRQYYGEDDEHVALRAKAAVDAGLEAIVCVGETEEQYRANETQAVVKQSLRASLGTLSSADARSVHIAYEPVWAIGTGLAATPDIVASVHEGIRKELIDIFGSDVGAEMRIIYGGSTKPDNIHALCEVKDVQGGLPGGASLEPDSFYELAKNGAACFKS